MFSIQDVQDNTQFWDRRLNRQFHWERQEIDIVGVGVIIYIRQIPLLINMGRMSSDEKELYKSCETT
jgi:hypothetical protein